jgi:hypothetical protein
MPRPRPLPSVPTETAERTLGRPPLIPGDDRAGYDGLLANVSGTVRPVDLIEAAWVRDVVDLIWEALRLRRLKAALMTACARGGMVNVLLSIEPSDNILALSRGWAARELEAVQQAEAILDAAGLGIDHVMAQALRNHIDAFERIDRMIASAEVRRAATLREIAHYRAELAASLRRAAQQAIEDAAIEDAADAEVETAATPAMGEAGEPQPVEAAPA